MYGTSYCRLRRSCPIFVISNFFFPNSKVYCPNCPNCPTPSFRRTHTPSTLTGTASIPRRPHCAETLKRYLCIVCREGFPARVALLEVGARGQPDSLFSGGLMVQSYLRPPTQLNQRVDELWQLNSLTSSHTQQFPILCKYALRSTSETIYSTTYASSSPQRPGQSHSAAPRRAQ